MTQPDDGSSFGAGESGAPDGTTSASGTTAADTSASSGEPGGDAAGSETAGSKFDVGGVDTDDPDGGDGSAGCEKVDFLFLVDGSGSMVDNQENLIANFPGFAEAIDVTLDVDYRVMVVDPDADTAVLDDYAGAVNCDPQPECCASACNLRPLASCGGASCPNPHNYEACDFVMGAGKIRSEEGEPCNFAGAQRWFTNAELDVTSTFGCAGRVHHGDDDEHQVEAVLEAVTTQNAPGGCNEGFLRDDALLVVVLLTDEEDGEDAQYGTLGTPALWKQVLVDAKQGDESAVVVLALIGDLHAPVPICESPGGGEGPSGQASPLLQEFAELFPYGTWGSVCEPDYQQFFIDAISVVDTACDEFEPEG